nr:N-6 DNA methylase [uncultured Rhodopila sp.]
MLTPFLTEKSLAAAAVSLADDGLTTNDPDLGGLLSAIRLGGDPLGDAFTALRSPAERRKEGAVYTPPAIVRSMLAWALDQATPARVVDPGAGSGRFLVAAGHAFPAAELVGIELDPLAARLLRANLAASGLAERAIVMEADYRSARLPVISGRTLFIGNPPYVRHHGISPDWKTWYRQTAAKFGIQASGLAGLHAHFFLRTLQLARAGDFGAFITASEWLDVNYGAAVRRMLTERLGCVGLHVLEPAAMPFAGSTTTGAITCFRVGSKPAAMRVRSVASAGALNRLAEGDEVPLSRAATTSRWSVLLRPAEPAGRSDFVPLGELVRVSRGQVTGCNRVWIAGDHARHLPKEVLVPTITKARELIAAGEELGADAPLRCVVNLPVDLDEIDSRHRADVDRFLVLAALLGADTGYIARHRRAWWSVQLYEPAPMVCTYMARRPPAFVRNVRGARHLNIAHGLYPREPLTEIQMRQLLAFLRRNVTVAAGRTYAGGLTKFEPRELERIPVPRLDALDAIATDMDRVANPA